MKTRDAGRGEEGIDLGGGLGRCSVEEDTHGGPGLVERVRRFLEELLKEHGLSAAKELGERLG